MIHKLIVWVEQLLCKHHWTGIGTKYLAVCTKCGKEIKQ